MTRSDSDVIDRIGSQKYWGEGQTREEAFIRIANSLSENDIEAGYFRSILLGGEALPAGRILTKYSTQRDVTALNCFVSETIEDSMDGIMRAVGRSAETLRRSGGIGHDFSTIRPRGYNINAFDTPASGPVSFMRIWDATGGVIASAGNRRGAMMGVLRCDHPDIEEFIAAKAHNPNPFPMFNLSVGITDEFMQHVKRGEMTPLKWQGKIVDWVDAQSIWGMIMRYAHKWGDPGVLFLDTINRMNNLWYCETISATNPCGEQPLPPNGACLLGSLNLTKFITEERTFNFKRMRTVAKLMTRLLNRVIDTTTYPFPEQEEEMKNKRRIGLGVTGLANAIEAMGYPYGTHEFLEVEADILERLNVAAYEESTEMARRDKPFPLYDHEYYRASCFVKTLPQDIREGISKHGIRNSHLTSIAPTGSLSLLFGNVSSGLEPVFSDWQDRKILFQDSPIPETHRLQDYGVKTWGTIARHTMEVPVQDHLEVLTTAQHYVDSAVSKTINCATDVDRQEFDAIYMRAWQGGAKGCTVYRSGCEREGILKEATQPTVTMGDTCYIDEQGQTQCG